MSATVKLPYTRFVKRVSNGASLSKYGYIGMMKMNEEALWEAPWVEARCDPKDVTLTTNQLTKTDGVFDLETATWTQEPTYTAYMEDKYDAFKQAGDAVARNATMCGYAGCVLYRFNLPTLSGGEANIPQGFSLVVQRDRYLRSGVKISAWCSNTSDPSAFPTTTIRGGGATISSESNPPAEGVIGVKSFGFLGQPNANTLMDSRAYADTFTIEDTSQTGWGSMASGSRSYLWVALTLEDYEGRWDAYKPGEARQYYIEGSAMLVADQCTFTFSGEISNPTESVIEIGYSTILKADGDGTEYVSPDHIPQLFAGSDVLVVSACGAPIERKDGDTVSIGMNGYSLTSEFKSLGYADEEGLKKYGVPYAYSQFYEDKMVRCVDASEKNDSLNQPTSYTPSASFDVMFVLDGVVDQSVNKIPAVIIHRKKLLIPFTIPIGFAPKKIRLTWRFLMDTYNIKQNVEIHNNVWIAVGKDFSNNYSLPVLQRHELFTAESSLVGDFSLLGSVISKTNNQQNIITFDLPERMNHGTHTLLLTVFFDSDQLTYGADGNVRYPYYGWSQHIIGLTFGDITGIVNHEHASDRYPMTIGGAMGGGWHPTIELIA